MLNYVVYSHVISPMCETAVHYVIGLCIMLVWIHGFNSLAPGRFEWKLRWIIIKLLFSIDSWVISCETTLKRWSQAFTNRKLTLAQVMAWCRQATSHYLSQCWPRSLLPYGGTRPQCVKVTHYTQFLWKLFASNIYFLFCSVRLLAYQNGMCNIYYIIKIYNIIKIAAKFQLCHCLRVLLQTGPAIIKLHQLDRSMHQGSTGEALLPTLLPLQL